MIVAIAAALAAAQPSPCPDLVTAEAFVCRAIRASADQKPMNMVGADYNEQNPVNCSSGNPCPWHGTGVVDTIFATHELPATYLRYLEQKYG